MGLSSAIKRLLSIKYAATAWVAGAWSPPANEGRTSVVVWDYLTQYMKIPQDRPWRVDVLFQVWFWRAIERVLCNPAEACEAWIVVCDDRAFCTAAKYREQAGRVDARCKGDAKKGLGAPEPYEDADGWLADLDEVDLRRLKATDKRGTALWEAFIDKLCDAMRHAPAGRCVIFDFNRERGALRIESGGEATWIAGHAIGEADPGSLWWVAHYAPARRTVDYHLVSVDSDMLALYTLHHDRCVARGQRVYWHESVKPLTHMVDLGAMCEQLRVTTGLRAMGMIGAWMIVCGTDFFDRTRVAHGITEEPLLEAFVASERYAILFATPDAFLRAVLKRAWFTKLSRAVDVPERFRRHVVPHSFDEMRGMSAHVPSEAVLRVECARFAWNLDYWTRADTGRQPVFQEAQAIEPAAAAEQTE